MGACRRIAPLLELLRGIGTAGRFRKNEEITMPNAREPLLKPVPITELRPTQITVGLREVKAKRGAKKAPQKAPNSWASI